MTFRDLIGSACAGLLQQKLRTLLTLGGVTLGAMLLFCSVSGGLGVLDALHRRLSVGDRLLAIRVSSGIKAPTDALTAEYQKRIPDSVSADRRKRLARSMALQSGRGKTAVPLTLASLEELRQIDGVGSVVPKLSWRSPIDLDSTPIGRVSILAVRAGGEAIESLIVFGEGLSDDAASEVLLSESFLFAHGFQSDAAVKALVGKPLRLLHLPGGRLPEERVDQLRESILIRERLLQSEPAIPAQQRAIVEQEIVQRKRQLQTHEQAVADVVASPDLTIAGIFRSPEADGFQSNPGLVDAFYNHAFVPVDTAVAHWERCFPANRPIVATVRADSSDVVQDVLGELRSRNFRCDSLADIAQRIRSAVLLVSAIVTAIAAGAFLIAALGMTNTMVMNVLERRREIGILKSIGARDADVMKMFLAEGLLVGIVGGILGLLLGFIVMWFVGGYLQGFLEQRLDEPFDGSLFVHPLWLLIATPVTAGLVTTVASFVPARRAARLDPVETLRAL